MIDDYSLALLVGRIVNVEAIFIPIFYLQFVYVFLGSLKRRVPHLAAGYLITIGYMALAVTNMDLFIPMADLGTTPIDQ